MAGLDQTLLQLKQFWIARTQSQRLFLGIGGVLTLAILGLFANLIATPDYKTLITGLEPADEQTISADLAAKKIPFQLSPDGKTISVPADQVDAARLGVAANQSTHSGRMGFEMFDKISWGQTEFEEKVNYQRALEGELERTIGTLGGVKSARVHLVMATDSVFLDKDKGAKASVTLKLSRDGLSHEATQSIQRLISGAVQGLRPSDVSIIDADSNASLGNNGDIGGEEGMERLLTQRVMATLSPVIGMDHLRASVSVEYDPGTTEESQEKYDPAVSVPLTIQRSDEQTGSGAGVGGVPGTSSNVPQNKPNVPSPIGGGGDSQVSKTENATYGVNKTVKHSIEPAGRIKRITAALVVDDSVKRKLGADGKWSELRTRRSAQELKQIETLVQSAIGLDTTRGDTLSVENLAFDRPEDADVKPVNVLDRARKGVADFSSVIRYAMLLILFVLAYVLAIRPVQKKILSVTVQPTSQPLLPDVAAVLPLPAPSSNVAHTLALKEQIVQQVKAEPSGSARVVQAWLRGETE